MRPKSEREQLGLDPSAEEQAELEAQQEVEQQNAAEEAVAAEPEGERPAWLPEKFKSEEEFAKAYGSLENELRERGNRERELTDRMEAMAAEAARQPQAQTADPMEAYAIEMEAAMEAQDGRRVAELNAWLTQHTVGQVFGQYEQQNAAAQAPQLQAQNELIAMQAKDTMVRRHDDWGDKEARIAELLVSDPDLLPESALNTIQGTVNALERAYKLVGYEEQAEQLAQLHEQGVSAADLGRSRKLSAQTLSGSSGRPGEPSEADKQVAEMREALDKSSWEAQSVK